MTGSPNNQPALGYYANYQWPMYPPQYYPQGPNTAHTQSGYGSTGPACPSPMDTSNDQDDRSATPTPVGRTSSEEAIVETDGDH
jgi:hypothetical protein